MNKFEKNNNDINKALLGTAIACWHLVGAKTALPDYMCGCVCDSLKSLVIISLSSGATLSSVNDI
jgi:hypothetical protein